MTKADQIDCGSCVLRRWRIEDRESLIRYANNWRVWRNLRDIFPHPYTESDADAWLEYATAEQVSPWVFAIEVDAEAAGGISLERGFDIERHSAEIGYWLGEPFWGRGIATDAVRAITARAFQETDLYRLYGWVFAWNPASMRVLEKAGYAREGVLARSGLKDGVLIDRVMYAITRDPGIEYVAASR
jgi:[ribosomal protein S5]-alanine N-acetyltransferase